MDRKDSPVKKLNEEEQVTVFLTTHYMEDASSSVWSASWQASGLTDMQGFQMVLNFLVMPIFFLSGALFPLTNVPLP